MDIFVRYKSCPACRVQYGIEERPTGNIRLLHDHRMDKYMHIIDMNDGSTYVNPEPWSNKKLRIEKGKTRDDYWEE